jgi:hypothetical protein
MVEIESFIINATDCKPYLDESVFPIKFGIWWLL